MCSFSGMGQLEFKDHRTMDQIVYLEEKLFTVYHQIKGLPLVCEIGLNC